MTQTPFQPKRTFWWITGGVLCAHVALLLGTLFGLSSHATPKPTQRLVVRTVTLNPSPTVHTSSETEVASVAPKRVDSNTPPPATKDKTPTLPKKTTPPTKTKPDKPPTKPKPTAKTPPAPQTKPDKPADDTKKTPTLDPQKLALIAEAQEKMAKIRSTSEQLSQAKTQTVKDENLPKIPVALEIDGMPVDAKGLVGPELTYQEELIGRLKLLLRLPEYGLVRVKLTLERSGKVKQLTVTNAESSKNKSYIEKTLPTLTFPAFGNNFSGQDSFTFSLNLSNEL